MVNALNDFLAHFTPNQYPYSIFLNKVWKTNLSDSRFTEFMQSTQMIFVEPPFFLIKTISLNALVNIVKKYRDYLEKFAILIKPVARNTPKLKPSFTLFRDEKKKYIILKCVVMNNTDILLLKQYVKTLSDISKIGIISTEDYKILKTKTVTKTAMDPEQVMDNGIYNMGTVYDINTQTNQVVIDIVAVNIITMLNILQFIF